MTGRLVYRLASAWLHDVVCPPMQAAPLLLPGLRDIEDIYRNASVVLAYGAAEGGRVQAGDQEAASWCRLWNAMQSGRLALK